MKGPLIYILMLGLCISWYGTSAQKKAKDCRGGFRWDVKTLTDSAGLAILDETPSDSTIAGLVSAVPPARLHIFSGKDKHLPRFASEKYLVRVRALLVAIQVKGDQDFHIVLKDPESGSTMIGEIPDPDCLYLADFPQQRERYRPTRKQGDDLKRLLKSSGKPILVTVTGVPFWDAPHWWLFRSAKNGREIHPILDIRVVEP